MINDLFNWCVLVIEIMAEYTGMSYELINIGICVILQPLLILIFFYLWRREKQKFREISDYHDYHK